MTKVKYQDMDGAWHEVEPLPAYSVVNRAEHMICAECDELSVASGRECIDLALRVLASEPFYLRKDSIPWLMTYVAHIGDLLDAKKIGPKHFVEESVYPLFMEHENAYQRFVYVTRFVGAISFIVESCFTGAHWIEEEPCRSFYSVDQLVSEAGYKLKLVQFLNDLYRHFQARATKADMTSRFIQGVPVVFRIPAGERAVIPLPGRDLVLSEGRQLIGVVERFHLSSQRFPLTPQGYGEMVADTGLGWTPFHIHHPVTIDYHTPASMPWGYSGTQATLHIPHEWIVAGGYPDDDDSLG